jgi:hypothetical protein
MKSADFVITSVICFRIHSNPYSVAQKLVFVQIL